MLHRHGLGGIPTPESSEVLYAYNVKKNNFQSAAESFAKHFNDDYLKKQKQP